MAEAEKIIAELARTEKLLEKRRDLTDKEVLRQLAFFKNVKALVDIGPLDPISSLPLEAGLKGVGETLVKGAQAARPLFKYAAAPLGKELLEKFGLRLPKVPEMKFGPISTIEELIELLEKYPHEPIRLRAKEEYEAARLQNASPVTHSDATEKRMREAERALQEQDNVLRQLIKITRAEYEKTSARGDRHLAADQMTTIQKYEKLLAAGLPAPFNASSVLPKPVVSPLEGIKQYQDELENLGETRARIAAVEEAASDNVTADYAVIGAGLKDWVSQEQRVAAAILGVSDAQLAVGLSNKDLDAAMQETFIRMSAGVDGVADACKEAVDANDKAAEDINAVWASVGESLKDTLAGSLQSVLDGKIKSIGDLVNNIGGTVSGKLKGFVSGKATEALTGMLGSFSAFAGPLGGLIGSAAGALAGKAIDAFGKLFGGKPSDKTEATTFDLASGYRLENDLGKGKDSPENRALANEIESQVRRINDALIKAGLSSSAHGFMIEAGSTPVKRPP